MLAPQVPQREPNLPAAAAPPVQTIKSDFPDRTLSGLGGVNTGRDAAEFILLGSHTVQARPGRCEATCALHLPFSGQTGFCQQGRRSPAVGCFVHICEAQRCRQQQALMASALRFLPCACRCAPGSCCTATRWSRSCAADCRQAGAARLPSAAPTAPALCAQRRPSAPVVLGCWAAFLGPWPFTMASTYLLQAFMEQHNFESLEDFRGASLSYFTTHHELVRPSAYNLNAWCSNHAATPRPGSSARRLLGKLLTGLPANSRAWRRCAVKSSNGARWEAWH